MKRCPVCQRELADHVAFCEADGHRFASGASRTLGDLARAESPLPLPRSLALVARVAELLEGLGPNAAGVRFLHPDDLTLSSDSHDVALVPFEGREPADRGAPYAPLEVLEGSEGDATARVYFLGALLYELLTGAPPFRGGAAVGIVRQTLERPRAPSDLRPSIPASVSSLTLLALERDPSRRPNAPATFAVALRGLALTLPAAPPPSAPLPSAPLPSAPPSSAPPSSAPPPSAPPPLALLPSAPGHILSAPSPAPYEPAPLAQAGFSGPPFPSQRAGAPLPYQPPASRRSSLAWWLGLAGVGLALVCVASVFLVGRSEAPTSPTRADAPPTNTGGLPVQTRQGDPTAREPRPVSPPTPREPPPVVGPPTNLPTAPTQGTTGAPITAPTPPVLSPDSGPSQPRTPDLQQPQGDPAPWLVPAVVASLLALASFAAVLVWKRRRDRLRAASAGQTPPERFPAGSSPTIPPAGPPLPPSSPPPTRPLVVPPTLVVPPPPSFRPAETLDRGDAYANTLEASAPAGATPPSLQGAKRCPSCTRELPQDARFCPHDGARLDEPPARSDRPADGEARMDPFVLGQYQCFARLGQGGMGVVYKARHVHLDRLAAVKVLLPGTSRDARAIERFRREAKLASSINHPNSVTIYDYGEAGQLFYLAMEFIQGRTLSDLIRGEPLPVPRALALVRQLCDGLDVAHQAGIVHRDLKPQNLMVCERPGRPDLVKILDFGIARSLSSVDARQTLSGGIVGTPGYMSPEQARGERDVDARSDVYSLALIVYQMLSGEVPFDFEALSPLQQVVQRATARTPPPALRESRPSLGVPASVDAALARALQPDRALRTPTVMAFASDLGLS